MTGSLGAKHSPIRVIGVGNTFRGDDAAGIMVARRLADLDFPGIEILEHSGEGSALMEAMKSCETLFMIDAMQPGSSPGKILRFEAQDQPLSANFSATSTHAFGVAEAIEMARLLDELPARLIVYGIEGKNYKIGQNLSPEVEQAIQKMVDIISMELNN